MLTIFYLALSSFFLTYFLTSVSINVLKRLNVLVEDYHKPNKPKVPRPGGPAIVTSIIFTELILYLYTGSTAVLAVILVTAITFLVGLVDDLLTLSGPLKSSLLVLGALPILLLDSYSYYLYFPFFGSVRLSLIYPILVLIAIPVVANTVNTIDVLNGVVSAFMVLASIPLLIALIIKGDFIIAAATLPLILSCLAFYNFHRYPSKIFPGDSGTLALGGAYVAITIVGGVEFVGVVALLPAILNSFFYLSSVRSLIEHRMIRVRPAGLTEGYKLMASRDPEAPITLVRMILADGPMGEKEIIKAIVLLSSFSCFLAILTAFATWGL